MSTIEPHENPPELPVETDGLEAVSEPACDGGMQTDRLAALCAEVQCLRTERVALEQAHSALEARLQASQAECAAALAKGDGDVRQMSQSLVQAWLEQRQSEHAMYAQLLANARTSIAALERETAELRCQLDQQSQQQADLQAELELAQMALRRREVEEQERGGRSRIYDNEMLSAEAQIELIKELLRELRR